MREVLYSMHTTSRKRLCMSMDEKTEQSKYTATQCRTSLTLSFQKLVLAPRHPFPVSINTLDYDNFNVPDADGNR